LQAEIELEEWQTDQDSVVVGVRTHSLDGLPRAATGWLRIDRLRQPPIVSRAAIGASDRWYERQRGGAARGLEDWEIERFVRNEDFEAGSDGRARIAVALPAGPYRMFVESRDSLGRRVHAQRDLIVLDSQASRFSIRTPYHVAAKSWSCEPGETFEAVWGTGYARGCALVQIECRGKVLHSEWTPAGRTQVRIRQQVEESMRGGFTLRILYERENRLYRTERIVDVPWSNKHLTLQWAEYHPALTPGGQDNWALEIADADSLPAHTEVAAVLYDASLDAFQPHDWAGELQRLRRERLAQARFSNQAEGFSSYCGGWTRSYREPGSYRVFSPRVNRLDWTWLGGWVSAVRVRGGRISSDAKSSDVSHLGKAKEILSLPVESVREAVALNTGVITQGGGIAYPAGSQADASPADVPDIVARRNLEATAFFFPELQSDERGRVTLSFTMPEALTEWKFIAFAHDADLRSGTLVDRAVTSRDLMVMPKAPRFVREGDRIGFPVEVVNRSDSTRTGLVRLTLTDAATHRNLDAALANRTPAVAFTIPPRQSRTYTWPLRVPDDCGFLGYRAVAAGAGLSDGEEGFLPVLSRRLLVAESIPLPMRGAGRRTFEFAKLLESNRSRTLRHRSLTVQVVSQPAWYAVLALPCLMEEGFESNQHVFDRLYANLLGRKILDSDPKIRQVFEQWRATPALDSPLERNADLASIALDETPWLREAKSESEARRNVGRLFDRNRIESEIAAGLRKLDAQCNSDGMWPWFAGGPSDPFITLRIVTGLGRLRHMGVQVETNPTRALDALDAWMSQRYDAIVEHRDTNRVHLSAMAALYLYGRSFYPDHPVAASRQHAFDFWRRQAADHWLEAGSRLSQAQIALALHRLGDTVVPEAILKSLRERSVHDEELGMFWRDLERSWWWHRAPIETQATMIEAFAEVGADSAAVEDCKVWLLAQKHTQSWPTTAGTVDAIYALLLRGAPWLGDAPLVEVALAGTTIVPEQVEAGTGSYEKRWLGSDVTADMGHIVVSKQSPGVAWGGVHWQYLEDIEQVTPAVDTPLKIAKSLYVVRLGRSGRELVPLHEAEVGDELVTRLVLRTDRDMEYVHLKDQRGSGTEPVDVRSGYRYRDGLAYYQTTRDTATHFFIADLPKGTYVLEYDSHVQLHGQYDSGIATAECLYAPEFSSHTESFAVVVP
jgi:hypothetical protein